MLVTIIRKEILTNITSLRFVLTLLLVTAIFVVSGFVFVDKHKQEISDFTVESNKNLAGLNESAKNLSRVTSYVQTIYKQPKITQVFCEGFEKTLPNTFEMNVFSIRNPRTIGRTNFLFQRFADIDWVFVISVILSFVALLLTFDSLSAERERGTLSLIISNSLPRDKVILGKYVSAILTLMIPLFFGLLINLIIINISGFVISGGQWLKITAFVGISILYLSIFLLIGILVSSRSAKSSSSIVMLLFIWVILVIVIPACGRIVSERFVQVPSRPEVDRRIEEARSEIWKNAESYGKNAGNWAGDKLDVDWVNPPARARLVNAITDTRNLINEEYINQIIEQVKFGRNVTKISPSVIYQSASEATIGTGVSRFGNLYGQLKIYKDILKSFIMDEDKRESESRHLLAEGHPILLSQKPVDYNSIPRFSELDIPMRGALKTALWDIGALILLNLMLFMAVYVSFLRCDVRQK